MLNTIKLDDFVLTTVFVLYDENNKILYEAIDRMLNQSENDIFQIKE